jgi:hypothetical protein
MGVPQSSHEQLTSGYKKSPAGNRNRHFFLKILFVVFSDSNKYFKIDCMERFFDGSADNQFWLASDKILYLLATLNFILFSTSQFLGGSLYKPEANQNGYSAEPC